MARNEPTHTQHELLMKMAKENYVAVKCNDDEDIEIYWELTRAGYLRNLVILSGPGDWEFTFSPDGFEYVEKHEGK